MTPVGERLFVLSSEEPLSDDLHFTAVAVETLVSALREQFHYVIVDVPRIPAAPYRRALEMADFRVIVADQTLRSVRDTVRLRAALGEGDGKRPQYPRRQPPRRGRAARRDPAGDGSTSSKSSRRA